VGRAVCRGLVATVVALICVVPATAAPPAITARAYILINPEAEEVLAQHAADTRLPMASTTKMMTALVTLKRAKLDALVTVPRAAAAPGGSSSGLVPGERLRVRTLLTGLMIGSGNDASITLAVYVGKGSEQRFVGLMNTDAAAMGLTNTRFANPHGLDARGHYSTVRDLVVLGQRTLEQPFLRQTVAKRVATIPGPNGRGTRRLESENDLLSIDPEADGIKTGHTNGAGYSLVTHARRKSNGVELYAAIIGSPSRTQRARDAKRLLDWGLRQYVRVVPLTTDEVIVSVPVRDRPGVSVPLVVDRELAVTIHTGRALKRTIVAPAELVGPVAAGSVVGEVRVTDGPKVVGVRKLVVTQAVDGPSVAERIRSGFGRLV
jgi:serine-type D-Ala-D-Ala carboxypeptidase (penicillin-binding protein 5/6)